MTKKTALVKTNRAIEVVKGYLASLVDEKEIAELKASIDKIEKESILVSLLPGQIDELNGIKKKAEVMRKVLSDPLNELLKKNQAVFKPPIDRIDALVAARKATYTRYVQEQEAKRRAEIAEREKLAEEQRRLEEEKRQALMKAGKTLPPPEPVIVVPETPPPVYEKRIAKREIRVDIVDPVKLIKAIAASDNSTLWTIINSDTLKIKPIQDIARTSATQEMIDYFKSIGVDVEYLPTIEDWK
jgi:hypothetical protein